MNNVIAATSYSPLRKALHWGVALLWLSQFPTGWEIANSHAVHLGFAPSLWSVIAHRAHALIGATVLMLVLARVFLRFRISGPVALETGWQAKVATLTHLALYAVLVALPLTGFVAMYITFRVGPIHIVLTNIAMALVALHTSAAFWHQFIRRDATLARMLPSWGSGKNLSETPRRAPS